MCNQYTNFKVLAQAFVKTKKKIKNTLQVWYLTRTLKKAVKINNIRKINLTFVMYRSLNNHNN